MEGVVGSPVKSEAASRRKKEQACWCASSFLPSDLQNEHGGHTQHSVVISNGCLLFCRKQNWLVSYPFLKDENTIVKICKAICGRYMSILCVFVVNYEGETEDLYV